MARKQNELLAAALAEASANVTLRSNSVDINLPDHQDVAYHGGETWDGTNYYIVQAKKNNWRAKTCYSIREVVSMYAE